MAVACHDHRSDPLYHASNIWQDPPISELTHYPPVDPTASEVLWVVSGAWNRSLAVCRDALQMCRS